MKRIISVFTAALLLTGLFPAAVSASEVSAPAKGKSLQIVTTIFPEYDWVMNILGDNPAGAEVTMLLDDGVDLHSYQPTVEDMLAISNCDLFIYVGGESDHWVEDALAEAVNPDMQVINLLAALGAGVKEEELVEGMQEEEHGHDGTEEHHDEEPGHDEGHEHGHEEGGPEYDEHVWLSLRHASSLVRHISGVLEQIDPENAEVYSSNTDAYVKKLEALDAGYQEAVSGAGITTLLFGDRFPFRYLVDDYGLNYYAAFAGCSAETEASFETVAFLAGKADELSLHTILVIEGSDHRIAETIAQNTSGGEKQILVLDSMQSATAKDVLDGKTYLSIMESNLGVLKEALK